ncbi:unnamed protein product [Peniophora sp. CBMAI 1063]|nr:unnamed protein product [Peniophora sp. CBMAI 1063]
MAVIHIQLQQQGPPESPAIHEHGIQDALNFIPNRLSPDDALNKTDTLDDLSQTLILTKFDSYLGLDGLPYEFWKHFHNRTKQMLKERAPYTDPLFLLETAFRDIERHGYCASANLNESLLCPIHKKVPLDLSPNYRPITLLNTGYKLYTK